MKVLFFSPYAIKHESFHVDLELIQTHLDQGDDVVVMGCNAALAACDFNPRHELYYCLNCMGRRVRGLSLLSRPVPVVSLHHEPVEAAGLKTRFTDLSELRAYSFENFDVGWGVLATLQWLLRDPEPDMDAHRELISDLVRSSIRVYRSLRTYLSQRPVERVYLFNGKHAPLRAALRACQSSGVPCFVFESGQDMHHYSVFENVLPHDLAYNEARMQRMWAEAEGDPQRETVGASFYEERARGVTQAWYSYTVEQRDGLLPAGWSREVRNVAIFSSSDDEYGALGPEWTNPLYPSQIEALEAIAASLAGDPGMRLYHRMHPNLKGLSNVGVDRMLALEARGLRTIRPEDPVSSYALLRSADVVLTYGSTMGIEAAYWGRPSVLAGVSLYRNLGATHNAASHEDVVALLRRALDPPRRAPALVFGYYMKSFGVPFRYCQPNSPADTGFRGVSIRPQLRYGRTANLLRSAPPAHRAISRLSRALARRGIDLPRLPSRP